MHRLWSIVAVSGLCVAGVLAVAPAQASPRVTVPTAVSQATVPAPGPNSAGARSGHASARQRQDGEHRTNLGRVHAPWNDEFKCHNWSCKWVKHYTYVDLVAPDDINQELWDRLAGFARCVVGSAGIAVAATAIATGGVSLPVVVGILGVSSDVCGAVTLEEMARATIQVYDGT